MSQTVECSVKKLLRLVVNKTITKLDLILIKLDFPTTFVVTVMQISLSRFG